MVVAQNPKLDPTAAPSPLREIAPMRFAGKCRLDRPAGPLSMASNMPLAFLLSSYPQNVHLYKHQTIDISLVTRSFLSSFNNTNNLSSFSNRPSFDSCQSLLLNTRTPHSIPRSLSTVPYPTIFSTSTLIKLSFTTIYTLESHQRIDKSSEQHLPSPNRSNGSDTSSHCSGDAACGPDTSTTFPKHASCLTDL